VTVVINFISECNVLQRQASGNKYKIKNNIAVSTENPSETRGITK
jgi:hypothetical protein